MPAKVNLTGLRFGRLIVIKESHVDKHRHYHWLCRCDCGKEKTINGEILKRGESKSCGCLFIESARAVGKNKTHGQSKTRLYKLYKGIITRSFNKNAPAYKKYGAKGIVLCEEWLDFELFAEWAYANNYDDSLSIDRIDNKRGYDPENCRWVSRTVQGQNRSPCLKVDDVVEIKRMIEDGVEIKTICEKFNRERNTILRIKNKSAWSNI